jgi:hypothetical protein
MKPKLKFFKASRAEKQLDKFIERRMTKTKKKKTIQEDIEENYRKLIKNIDKLFEKEFGKMCPDFDCECIQCRVHLIYNNFKKELWNTFVK